MQKVTALFQVPRRKLRRGTSLTLTLLFALTCAPWAMPAEADVDGAAGFRAVPLSVPRTGHHGFTRMPPAQTGVLFTNFVSDPQLARNQILEIGSGVALGDIDGDGRTDIYLCSLGGSNRLFRNLGGWKFEDATTPAIACAGQSSTGAVFADVDGDGGLDLLVNGIGTGTRLFLNDGAGRFQEAVQSGLVRGHGSTSMALADIDGDGALDLYVANYHTRTFKDSPPGLNVEAGYVGGQFVIKPPGLFLPLFLKSGRVSLFERGETDLIYRNLGGGRFAPFSWTNGVFVDVEGKPLREAPKEWGLAVAFRDLNGDGAPDLYVCNDFFNSPDNVWLNTGSGQFRAAPNMMLRHISMSSMAVDFADLNRDGHDDMLVLDMMSREHERRHRQRGSQIHLDMDVPARNPAYRPEYPRNTVQLNRGDGTWAEIAQYCGLDASEWSWSVVFLDVDLDGFEDILITNGNLRDANDADLAKGGSGRMDGQRTAGKPRFPPLQTANVAFRNRGDLTFEECGRAWGFDQSGISHGMAAADLDNDGDLDVVMNNMRDAAGLYRNESDAPRVVVRTKGLAPNTQGIGAKIELLGGAVPRQSQEVISGGRYLSGDDPIRVFATGPAEGGMTIRVTWRNGAQSLVPNVRANYRYEVSESRATTNRAPASAPEPPLFENISGALRHAHHEDEYNDFERQPTLSRHMSRLGPSMAWRDLDGDGWDDLIVGGSRSNYSVVYLNDRAGGFKPLRRRDPLQRDQSALLTFAQADGTIEFLAGSSDYEDAKPGQAGVLRYDLQRGTEELTLPFPEGSTGPLALGFVDQHLALFVGGRVRPGRYPESVASRLFLRENGGWKSDPARSAVLASAGMVSGATWADLDSDGAVELILACDWGPIRVFKSAQGNFQEVTSSLGLEKYRGLWNGVVAGDLNGDGQLDLVASNWGRNTHYERHRSRPLRLYYGEWQGAGRMEMLECYYEPVRGQYAPFTALDRLREACPAVAEKFTTFAAYASASIDEIAGVRGKPLMFLEANWFETTLFLNEGGRFDPKPLPSEAQFAPAFGVSIADFDGDGQEDVFLSQNFFDLEPEISRCDAGRGLCLRGDGKGNLVPMPGQQSGIVLYGEQRAAAVADFDRDGRVDLAVGQNNGATGLFHNRGAKPGLRIRLRGPAWNRDALGAVIRLKSGANSGPARAIQAGSGYWSQDSVVQVMSAPGNPDSIQVRWPGGRITETPLTKDAREVLVSYD